jgi:hypothetical protein
MMKCILTFVVSLLMLLAASAQGQEKSTNVKSRSEGPSLAAVLEPKVRKSWEDYKNRNKTSFAASLANDFAEVTDDADGIFRKDTELSEMDHFNLAKYELKDFTIRPIGGSAALVTYTAEYRGSYDSTAVNMKTVYGEVWTKAGGERKQLWVQETKLK